jgi:PIN domain nuclease of toxin-antitoxin system
MRLLADTHVLVWAFTNPDMLSRRARTLLEDLGNEVIFSAVSAYEIEFKRPLDNLLAALPMELEAAVRAEGFSWRSISVADATAAGRLPRLHRDPWDRLLVAQCLQEGIPLISRDARLADYGVTLVW